MKSGASNHPNNLSDSRVTWDQLEQAFTFDCQLRNLTVKTLKCYMIRDKELRGPRTSDIDL